MRVCISQPFGSRLSRALFSTLFGFTAVAGCASGDGGRQQLNTGYRAFDQRQYDQAMAAADEFLKKTPSGEGSAEAYYLKGRVAEHRAEAVGSTGSSSDARADLASAHDFYTRGITQPAVPRVQSLLHAGLANVAYHLDDYGAALREWQLSYDNIEPNDAKAWVLYRIGLCQQRLGWFEMADRTFGQVVQRFPGTDQANRAAAHRGAHAFYVQVGAFTDAGHADKTIAALASQGFKPMRWNESGRELIGVGPVPSYAEARSLRARLVGEYPGAIIQP